MNMFLCFVRYVFILKVIDAIFLSHLKKLWIFLFEYYEV